MDMSKTTGYAQRREPSSGNAPTPEQYDALDLSLANTADGEILSDQAMMDLLEYETSSQSAHLICENEDEIDMNTTSAIKVRESRALIEEMVEGSTVIHHYQPTAAPISWLQRVLAWFGRS